MERVKAARGPTLRCQGWRQEAILRMLENNLENAEKPDQLIIYGGTGKAARNWEAFHRIVDSLKSLRDDETLIVQSGKPVAIFKTQRDAPRVLIANAHLVPKWSNWETFHELEALGLPAGVIVREYAARAPSAQPVCPFPEGDAGFVNWHLNVRPKDPTPFRDKEDGEDCLINAGYRFDDDGVWRNRSGETEGMVLPSEDGQGFRIVRLRAGADWRRHL